MGLKCALGDTIHHQAYSIIMCIIVIPYLMMMLVTKLNLL